MKYAPEHVYEDVEGETRVYDEMWMADWWWNTQVKKKLHERFPMLTQNGFRKNCL
jgi:hypothetical protein